MNASKTAVLTDSAADLPDELKEKYEIYTVRMKVIYHDRMYEDGEIDPMYIYEHFREEIPKTSTPNMAEVMDVIDEIKAAGYENIIGIMISSGLSGTFNVVRSAFEEEETLRTFAMDTKNISIGSGIYALYAAWKLAQGASFDETVEALKKKQSEQASLLNFYMDGLDYLAKGGRITPAVALVGKVLHLKPIIACDKEGVYYPAAKIRGQSKGVSKLVDLVIPDGLDISRYWISVMTGDGDKLAEQAIKRIYEKYPAVNIIIRKQITATMAIHTGPGLLGIDRFEFA
ncbi:MAG: DegV family protein [Lachnospiraceae bacterium]|jgi:DegV family protein with EDD domain